MARKTNSEKIDELQKVVIRLETKINNGLSQDIEDIKKSIDELKQKIDGMATTKSVDELKKKLNGLPTQVKIQWWFIAMLIVWLVVRSIS